MLTFFEKFPDVLAVMSEKKDGSMKIFEGKTLNIENRELFFKQVGIRRESVKSAFLAHGSRVEVVRQKSPAVIDNTDALVTKEEEIYLSVTVADCFPIFFYDSREKIIALVHAGWKGISKNIVSNTIGKIKELGGKISNINVSIGPGINVCHFEVGEEVAREFFSWSKFIVRKEGKIFIDLRGIIRKQLLKEGIKSENIEDKGECTFCTPKLFSYRRDKPEVVEGMIAVIGMKI